HLAPGRVHLEQSLVAEPATDTGGRLMEVADHRLPAVLLVGLSPSRSRSAQPGRQLKAPYRGRNGCDTFQNVGALGREPIVLLVAQGIPVGVQCSGQLALMAKRRSQGDLRMA